LKHENEGDDSRSKDLDGASNNMKFDDFNDYDLFVSNSNHKQQFDAYLDEPVLPRSSDFDRLSWWKLNGVKYPILQEIARDILVIPLSSVASESAFNTCSRIVSSHRNKLHLKMIEALCAQN